jgi:hypothetical protein
METSENGHEPQKSVLDRVLRHPWWLGIGGLLALVGLVFLILFGFGVVGGSDKPTPVTVVTVAGHPVSPAKDAKSRGDEIESREFWTHPPEMFAPVPKSFATDTVNISIYDNGDVAAYSPSDLADTALQYPDLVEGRTFFIVGRVVDTAVRPSEFGLNRELIVVGANQTAAAVIGSPAGNLGIDEIGIGDVVYVVVRIAAVGDGRVAADRRVRRIVYVVTPDDSEPDVHKVDFPIGPTGIGSLSIRTLANASRR